MKPSVTHFALLLAFIYGALLPLASSAEPVPMAPAQQLGRRAPLMHHTTSKHHTSLTRTHTTYKKHTKKTSKTTTKGTHTKKSSKKTTKLKTTKAHAGKTSRHTTSKLNANANVVPSASSSKPPSSTAKSTATTQSKPASSPSPTKTSSTTAAPKPTTTNSNKPSSTSSPAKSTSTAAAPKPSTSTQTVKEAGSSSSSVKPPSTLPSPTKTTSSSPVPTKTTPASSPAKSSSTASAPKPTATTQTVMGAGNSPTSSAKPDASPSPTKSTSILPSGSSKPDASPSPTKSTSVLPASSSKPDASPSPPKSTSIVATSSSKPETKSTSIVGTSSSKPTATSQSVKISGTSSRPPSGSPSSTGKPTATSQTTSTASGEASGEASAPGYTGVPPGPGAYLYSDPSQLTEPQVLTSANGFLNITLTVKVARHTGFISFNSRQYSCNGITAIPGPTWNITAGDTVTLTIINELEANNDADDLVDMTLMNTMHSPNSTNIHTHGLHVSSSQDNVFQRIYPGETFQYKYTIPEDHAPGLHWYHSHKHGTSALQVMGGLVGAIYVRPTEAAVKKSTALTYLASLERHVLVAQHFAMESINSDTDDTFTVRTYEYLSSLLKSQVPINAEYVNSSVKDIYFINGQFQPKLAMMPGTPVVLDIVNAVGDVVIELDIRDSPQASSVSSSCSLVQIASDGIYFTSAKTLGYVAMMPGNRASIIIQCTKPGTYYLTNIPSMVTLVVGGTETTAFTSYDSLDLSTIVRPVQLKDTLNTVVTSKWELSVEQEPGSTRPITGIGMGSECGIESTDSNCQYLSFPGELSTTGPYRHITYVGAVDELVINGKGSSAHSVHIHVNHFQVVSDELRSDAERYFYRIGDWRDTIPAFPGKVKVRQNVQDFSGEVVVHCHFLMHEDMGMMATYYVRPANESSKGYCTYPGGTGTSGSCALSDGVVLSSATLSAAAAKTNSPVTSK
ncbi:hypothetical protein HDU78_006731 [Chytriomyces hyalinus]|nr:hypothetical protein HDU78_006731 [Chytriomyces hyalinus]